MLPIGLVSKNKTGALRMASNILLCSICEALSNKTNNRIQRNIVIATTVPDNPP